MDISTEMAWMDGILNEKMNEEMNEEMDSGYKNHLAVWEKSDYNK